MLWVTMGALSVRSLVEARERCITCRIHAFPPPLFCTVSDAVATHPTLQRLALDGNFIGDAGCISGI